MTNRQIHRHIRAFTESRAEWLQVLNRNPDGMQAAQMIVQINSKIELLRALINWSLPDAEDEGLAPDTTT